MTSVGDYDLEHQIGAGASGTVWKAHRRGPVTRVVALKRLRAGSSSLDLARIRREATVLTELDHPHVVRVLEVIHDGDGVALAMQYAPGGSLDDLLAERRRLTPGQVVAVAAPIADALASAHRRGVLHGDVKPANVLFTSDGEPLLTDFGVARTLGHVTSDQISGTAEYLAPELLDGAQPDPRADIYSLAVVCYQALAGQPPYTGPVPLAVARAADVGDHVRLETMPDVPEALARVVEQAMDRRPERRFATADELARALRTTVPAGEVRVPGPAAAPRHDADDTSTGLTRTFGPRPPRPEPTEPRPRRRVPLVAVAGLLAAGGIYLVRGPLASDDGDRDPEVDCPVVAPPVAAPGGQVVDGDVAGDGCTVSGVFESGRLPDGTPGMVLTILLDGVPKQIGIGAPGDQLVLGDWNCDGVDTPGLYRAGEGDVQYFDVWPAVEQRSYRPDATEQVITGGVATLVRGQGTDGDCDRIDVSASSSEADAPGAAGGGRPPVATEVRAPHSASRTAGTPASAIIVAAGGIRIARRAGAARPGQIRRLGTSGTSDRQVRHR